MRFIASLMTALSFLVPVGMAQTAMPPGPTLLSPMALIGGLWSDGERPADTEPDAPPEWAVRRGAILYLRIDGDRQLLISDVALSWELSRKHRYAAWLAGPRFHLVNVMYADQATTYLIDARDGSVRDIGAPPVLSRSERLAIVWTANFKDGHVGPRILDFRVNPPAIIDVPGGPNCEKRADPTLLRPTAVWADDTLIRFEGTYSLGGQDPNAKQILRIVDGKAGWEC